MDLVAVIRELKWRWGDCEITRQGWWEGCVYGTRYITAVVDQGLIIMIKVLLSLLENKETCTHPRTRGFTAWKMTVCKNSVLPIRFSRGACLTQWAPAPQGAHSKDTVSWEEKIGWLNFTCNVTSSNKAPHWPIVCIYKLALLVDCYVVNTHFSALYLDRHD